MSQISIQNLKNSSFAKAVLLMAAFLLLPQEVFAQSVQLPMITNIGCKIVSWMQGPLAIVVFLVVAVATIVIGMFAKMDWAKILTVVVLYGILQGLGSFLLSAGFINLPPSCLV